MSIGLVACAPSTLAGGSDCTTPSDGCGNPDMPRDRDPSRDRQAAHGVSQQTASREPNHRSAPRPRETESRAGPGPAPARHRPPARDRAVSPRPYQRHPPQAIPAEGLTVDHGRRPYEYTERLRLNDVSPCPLLILRQARCRMRPRDGLRHPAHHHGSQWITPRQVSSTPRAAARRLSRRQY